MAVEAVECRTGMHIEERRRLITFSVWPPASGDCSVSFSSQLPGVSHRWLCTSWSTTPSLGRRSFTAFSATPAACVLVTLTDVSRDGGPCRQSYDTRRHPTPSWGQRPPVRAPLRAPGSGAGDDDDGDQTRRNVSRYGRHLVTARETVSVSGYGQYAVPDPLPELLCV